MPLVAFCLDAESASHPDSLGLADENLCAQKWARLYTSAEEARERLLQNSEVDEIWVASSNDMEPINLAAALKRDKPDCRVLLLAFDGSGSLMSRANAAGIDATLDRGAFVEHYAHEKRRRLAFGKVAGSADAANAASADAAGSAAASRSCAVGGNVAHTDVAHAAATTTATTATVAATAACEAPLRIDGQACEVHVSPWQRTAFSVPGKAKRVRHGREAFFLPVVSGSGGAGKSSVSALLALVAKEMGYSTLLIDFDLQFGDMREMLGVADALSIDELLAAPARISYLKSDGAAPALLAAPRRVESCDTVMGQVDLILDSVLPQFDVVVANTGAFWVDLHALLLERASKALLLVDQRASSLRACKHAVDLCIRCGIATNPFVFAANKCAKGASFTSMDIACAMQGAHAVELLDGGRDVEDFLAAGMPHELLSEHNCLCASIEKVLSGFLVRPAAAKSVQIPEGAAGAGRAIESSTPKRLFGKKRSRGRRGAL